MNAEQINNIIRDPELLANTSTSELKALVERYPYFQCARMLYVKKLHGEKHLEAPAEIRNAACSLPSGAKLYQTLFKDKLMRLIEEEAAADERKTQTESEPRQAFNTPIPFSVGRTVRTEEPPAEAQAEQPAKADDTEEKKQDITPEITAEPEKKEVKADPAEVSQSEKKEIKEPEEESSASKKLEEEILKHAAETVYSLPDQSEEEGESGSDSEKEEKRRPQGFSDWLKALDNKRLNEIRERERKEKTGKIIDRFIEKQPSIKPAEDDEVFNPERVAKLGVVEDEEFVSETLADIYRKQGNVSKAKKIYNKLMLKYPEKKSYFARRIEELEKK